MGDSSEDEEHATNKKSDHIHLLGMSPKKLPTWTKVCFAVGGIPAPMTSTVINFFISIFLLEVAQINPFYVSVILFSGRAWDAITDPTVGILVLKTDTRFGKLRPWILVSPPFACAAYICLWYVPDFSEGAKVVWYLCFYCLYMGLLTCLHVPYTALTMYLSDDQKERDSATAYRMVAEVSSYLIGSTIVGFIVNPYRRASDCSTVTATAMPERERLEKQAYLMSACIVAGIYLTCTLVVFFGVRERVGVVLDKRDSFCSGFKLVISHSPYVKLTMAFLFVSLAVAIIQGNLALFATHVLGQGDQFALSMAVLLIVAVICVPLWQLCIVKIGKKTAFSAGMLLYIPTLFAPLFMQGNLVVLYIVLIIAGACTSVAFFLPWSMLPDVLDDFMLKEGVRKDAIFYSFFVFFYKFASGVALGISQLVLAAGGYDSKKCEQAESVKLTLRLLCSPAPVICVLLALIFMWWYPIDEKRRQIIRRLVEELRCHM